METLSLEMQIIKNVQMANFKYRQLQAPMHGFERSVLEKQRNQLKRDIAAAQRWIEWAKQ